MMIPEVEEHLKTLPEVKTIVLFGIEVRCHILQRLVKPVAGWQGILSYRPRHNILF